MTRLAGTRILGALVQILVVTLLAWLLFYVIARFTGASPAQRIAGKTASPAQIALVAKNLGLDQPYWRQYLVFLGRLVRGDFGYSYVQSRPVSQILWPALRATASLVLGAAVVWLGIAVPVGGLRRPAPPVVRRRGGPGHRHLGHVDPGLLAGSGDRVPVRLRADPGPAVRPGDPAGRHPAVPDYRLCRSRAEPGAVGLPPGPAVGHPGRRIRRGLHPLPAHANGRAARRGLHQDRPGPYFGSRTVRVLPADEYARRRLVRTLNAIAFPDEQGGALVDQHATEGELAERVIPVRLAWISQHLTTLQYLMAELAARWDADGRIADATLRPDER